MQLRFFPRDNKLHQQEVVEKREEIIDQIKTEYKYNKQCIYIKEFTQRNKERNLPKI